MRAAELKERPGFALMKQTDIQSIYYMQMPRWLFFDPRYSEMSLDAKVTYTFLLNRFQLSRRKSWINDNGEVFVIFPRRELAKELRICEKRVTAAFKALVALQLVWEKRCGLGDANQIYLAKVEPIDDPNYSCAPFEDECGSRTADSAVLEEPNLRFCNGGYDGSETAVSEVQEQPILPPSNKEKRNKELSKKEVSQSVNQDGRADDDEKELMGILNACELSYFPPETAKVFENAIERLYYADSFRIGSSLLPKARIRRRLRQLDNIVLQEAEAKLTANTEQRVVNSTAYVMATIFNCISETESDLMVDPYLNSLRSP